MKVVILAGGLGTRISEESFLKPKPMIEIGGRPILWHIMKGFENQGFDDFIICLGYKGAMIKDYFLNYFHYNSDITVDLATNTHQIHRSNTEKFKVTLVDTGQKTLTAGRLKRIQRYVKDEPFLMTYGDGLADVDLKKLVSFHKQSGKAATVTAVRPAGRFGLLGLTDDNLVCDFQEKPTNGGGWINGGFFVLQPEVFDFIPEDNDLVMWEHEPMAQLSQKGQLAAYKHSGFWKCMDALRDKEELEQMWTAGNPQWKTWD
ncbi:MAG: glucose-1-phosphate cytidylyltransferase [bacterium]|nr:glucose-1-phosphate cytidylyltransferase [bacterium]